MNGILFLTSIILLLCDLAQPFSIQSSSLSFRQYKAQIHHSTSQHNNNQLHVGVVSQRKNRKTNSSLNLSSKSPSSKTSFKVIFQKVIRPPMTLANPIEFLPSLVEYLQNEFTLPDNLPMIYEMSINDQDDDDGTDVGGDKEENFYSILEIESPLSKSSTDHKIFMEVVGIYPSSSSTTETENSDIMMPSMAMVVLKKKKAVESSTQNGKVGGDVIRQQLFQDSEMKIIKELDIGLDLYMEGKLKNINQKGSRASRMSSKKSNNDQSRSSNQGLKDDAFDNDEDDDEVGEWMGLNEFEGLNQNDSWEDLESILLNKNKYNPNDVIIDTTATSTSTNSKSGSDVMKQKEVSQNEKPNDDIIKGNKKDEKIKSPKEVEAKVKSTSSSSTAENSDFAVEAAKAAMAQRKKEKVISGGDFAVEAAKKAAKVVATAEAEALKGGDYAVEAAKKAAASGKVTKRTKSMMEEKKEKVNVKSHQPTSNQSFNVAPQEPEITQGDEMSLNDLLPAISPMASRGMNDNKPGSFRIKISNPKTFSASSISKRKMKIEKVKLTKNVDVIGKARANESKEIDKDEKKITSASQKQSEENIDSDQKLKKRKEVNIIHDNESIDPTKMTEDERQSSMNNLLFQIQQPPSSSQSSSTITKTREEIENDIYKAALDIMPGGTSTDNVEVVDDISAEELLRDVLKFGEEKEQEEAPGVGFVDGAMNKAKELISFEKIQQKPKFDLGYDEVSNPSTAEEELKRIFAAGQSIAETRISKSSSPSSTQSSQVTSPEQESKVTNEYVDELIASDKTVPRNARTLDEELAELEVRISRTPGENAEAGGTNSLFDVFSGPEVYNPNVDPETSVNWPGAKPGTRTDVNLPPELATAVKNARYAGKLLAQIVEEDGDLNIENGKKKFLIDGKEITKDQISKLQQCVHEGIAIGLINDPFEYLGEKSRLDMVLAELRQQPAERFDEIISNYRDLLLSDNFVTMIREKLNSMAKLEMELKKSAKNIEEIKAKHEIELAILSRILQYAQLLLKEARAIGAELEVAQLEVIRSICQVAMDPNHQTEEETALALTDAVRDMKPLLDENFVAYLKYAIAEEEGRLARSGLLDDPEHQRWLYVLKIVQEGVYAELSRGVQRFIDHISYVLRMETKQERRMLLSRLIDVMPSMDIRPFVKVVDNIAASLGAGTRGDFVETDVLGGMTNKILQLRRDVHDLLPGDRIKIMSKDADEWAARQRKKLLEQRGISQQRLKAAKETESYDEEIRQRGEIERFD